MKHLKAAVCLGLCLGIGLLWCPPAGAAGSVRFYLGGEGVYSFSTLTSGGFNTAGPFTNIGSDANNAFGGGAHLGLQFSGVVRLDFGYHYRGGLHYTTDSYVDVIEHYYYETDFDANILMGSIYVSPFPDYAFSPYVGAGVGAAMIKMATDDMVVSGEVSQTKLAWQLEAGLQVNLSDNFVVHIGYRYLNMGTANLRLFDEWNWDSGNFTGAVKAHEVAGGLRILF